MCLLVQTANQKKCHYFSDHITGKCPESELKFNSFSFTPCEQPKSKLVKIITTHCLLKIIFTNLNFFNLK